MNVIVELWISEAWDLDLDLDLDLELRENKVET